MFSVLQNKSHYEWPLGDKQVDKQGSKAELGLGCWVCLQPHFCREEITVKEHSIRGWIRTSDQKVFIGIPAPTPLHLCL